MIAQKSIQEVLAAAQIDEVVGGFVNLKRRGANQIGLCPFHDEKTPSFIVSPTKNIYKCFGCGKGGNSAQFLMESEGMNFVESIRYLADRYNIRLEEDNQTSEEYEDQKKHLDSLFIVNKYAEDYFQKELLEESEGRNIGLSYFKERGYRESTIKKFGLGYARRERDHFTKKAILSKYNIDYLRTLGLTTSRDSDFFNERVMFTIYNLSGKPIAFAGRQLTANKKSPKYINSPESEIYVKRKVLYGMYQAKAAIRKNDYCILVEGYTDVISLNQNGIENSVASSGTSLTPEQLRLIKRFTNNLTILYDGDQAGINAALRGLDLALEADLNVKVVVLPDGHDPDSYVSSVGNVAFVEYVKNSEKDFILFRIDNNKSDLNDPIKKTELTREIIVSLTKIRDSIKRAAYIQQCSIIMNIDEQILSKEVNKQIKNEIKRKRQVRERTEMRAARESASTGNVSGVSTDGNHAPGFPTNEDNTGFAKSDMYDDIPIPDLQIPTRKNYNPRDEYQEKDLVRIVMTHGDSMIEEEDGTQSVAEYIYSNIVDVIDFFDNTKYKEIIELTFERVQRDESIDPMFFTNHPDKEIQMIAVELLTSPYIFAKWNEKGVFLQTQKMPDINFSEDSFGGIIRFKLHKVKRVINQLQTKINELQASNKTEELDHYLKAFQKLQEERKLLAEAFGNVFI